MIKSLIREILLFFQLGITKNLAYDIYSRKLIRKYVKSSDNCVDIGAHKGEFLSYFIKQSPKGKHLAFEPIPHHYSALKNNWSGVAQIYPYALSNKKGQSEFQWVKNAEAYSGLKQRKYKVENPEIEILSVETHLLDEFKNDNKPIRFIKIDVEGAEFLVLQGAREILKTQRPFVLFEFGLGASDYYQNTPEELFQFFEALNYSLYSLKEALSKKEPYALKSFKEVYASNSDYYFWASPK